MSRREPQLMHCGLVLYERGPTGGIVLMWTTTAPIMWHAHIVQPAQVAAGARVLATPLKNV